MQTRTLARRLGCLLALSAAGVVALAPGLPAQAAPAPAGAVIRNVATATYVPAGLTQTETASSNGVLVNVQAVEALVLTQDQSITRPPGVQVSLSHLLTNTGNVASAYTLTLVNNGAGCVADTLDMGALRVLRDINGNGTADAADPVLGAAGAVSLQPGETAGLLVQGTLPASPAGSACLAVTATTAAGLAASNRDVITVGNAAVLSLVKTASYPNVVMPGATRIDFTVTGSNIGAQDAQPTGVAAPGNTAITVNGAPANLVLIRDLVPAGTQYLAGTLQSTAAGAVRLFRLPGDTPLHYRTTDDSSAIEVAIGIPTAVVRNGTVAMQFAVRTSTDLAGDIRNTAQAYYHDGANPVLSSSNTVIIGSGLGRLGVAKAASTPTLNISPSGGPDGTANVTFSVLLRNYGSVPLYSVQVPDVLEGAGATQFGSYTASAVPGTGQYAIVAGSLTMVSGNGSVGGVVGAANPAFTGMAASANLLAPGAVLPVGGELTVQFSLRINLIGRTGSLFNSVRGQAALSAGGVPEVFDDSANGSNPDVDGDGNPNNDASPTPVGTQLPALTIVKSAALPRRVATGVYELDYTFKVTNTGQSAAPNVRVIDNLNCTFDMDRAGGAVASWSLAGAPVTRNGSLNAAAGFTGNAPCNRAQLNSADPYAVPTEVQLSLVDGSRPLAAGQSEEIRLTVRVTEKPAAMGTRVTVTNRAWAAAFEQNTINVTPSMLVAAVSGSVQSLLVDPQGTVYDSVSRAVIAGAVVTYKRQSCGSGAAGPITAAEIYGGDSGAYTYNADGSMSMTTGADGVYQFFMLSPPVTDLCTYSLSVAPPAGSGYAAPSVQIPVQPGTFGSCGNVVANASAPQGSDPTTYYFSVRAGLNTASNSVCDVLHNHIPLDPGSMTGLLLKKEGSKSTVEFGDFMDYVLTVTNKTGFALTGVTVNDALPPGFAYVRGSARLGGVAASDPAGGTGPGLTFSYPTLALPVDASASVRYRVRIGVGSPTTGSAINRARASSGQYPSNLASWKVQVSGGVFSDDAYIFGKVYLDCKRPDRDGRPADNGLQDDAAEVGIPGVRLFLENGTSVITDGEGKWSLYGIKPVTHVLRLDQSTLPAGAVLGLLDNRNANDAQSRFADLKKGEFHKANFIVSNCDNQAMVAEVTERRALAARRGDLDGTLASQRLDAEGRPVVTGDLRGLPATGEILATGASGNTVATSAALITLPAGKAGTSNFIGAPLGSFASPGSAASSTAPLNPSDAVNGAPSPASIFAPLSGLPSGTQAQGAVGSAASTYSGVGSPLPAQGRSLEPAALPWLASAAPEAVDLETAMLTLDNQAGFIGLRDGDTVPTQSVNVRVKGVAGSLLRLTVNGQAIDDRRVGKKAVLPGKSLAAWEYIGVQLQPGTNTLQLDIMDGMGNQRNGATGPQRITLVAPDKLGLIDIKLPDNARADQRTPVVVSVRLTDARGVPVTARTQVTLESDAGRWLEEDLASMEPGTQVFMEGGSAEFRLLPPGLPGDVRVRVSAGVLVREVRLALLPEMRPMLGVGIVEGVLDFTKRGGLALGAAPAGAAFEAELTGLTDQSDATRAAGRAAFFFKGTVKGEYLLTTSYDSDKTTKDRLFRDIRPDEFYPVYGDSAARGFDAQSTQKLYVRIDKNRSYLLYGDFTTASSTEVRQLSQSNRSLTGIKHVYEDDKVRATSYMSRTDQSQQVEEFRAVGTSGPYFLSAANGEMVDNSEQIEILVRDRNQPNVVLQRTALTRFADYSIEPLTRRILFTRAISSLDSNLNPQSIRVTYEVESGGAKFTVAGTDVQAKLGENLQVGIVASTDENPENKRKLAAVTALARVGENTTVAAELVKTDSDLKGSGSAGRAEVRHQTEQMSLVGQVARTTEGFDNPGASFSAGRTEATTRAEYRIDPTLALRAEALYGRDASSPAPAQKSVSASVQKKLSDTTIVEAGISHAVNSTSTQAIGAAFDYGQVSTYNGVTGGNLGASSVTTLGAAAASAGDETTETVMRGRLTMALPGVPRAQIFFEAEQGLGSSSRRALGVGVNYAITDKTRVYGRYELAASGTDDFSTINGAGRNAGILGIESNYMEGGRVYNEYRLTDAADGRSVQAATGIRNTFALNREVRLTAGVEHTQVMGGSKTGNTGTGYAGTTGGSTAVIFGAEYLTEQVKASGVAEARAGSDANTYLVSAGLGYKIDSDWSLLARSTISNSEGQNASAGNDRLLMRQQVGLAYRPVAQDLWNALLRYEHRSERVRGSGTSSGAALSGTLDSANVPGTTTTDILAATANYNPRRGNYLTARYAGKISRAEDAFVSSAYWAHLIQARYTLDLTRDWDLGLQAGLLYGKGGALQKTLGLEVGYQAATNVWVSGGYNLLGLTDRDLTADYTSKGVYIRLRYKFDESQFGFSPVTAPAQQAARSAPTASAAAAVTPAPATAAPAPVSP